MWSIVKPVHAAIHCTIVSIDTKVSIGTNIGVHGRHEERRRQEQEVGADAGLVANAGGTVRPNSSSGERVELEHFPSLIGAKTIVQ